MPRICIDKRDGSVVPDFQPRVAKGSLISNAVKRFVSLGQIVTTDDFEEKEVTEIEFSIARDLFITAGEPARAAKRLDYQNNRASLRQKILDLGFTVKEFKVLTKTFFD